MRALDLFCCAGGASDGLRRAGFDVEGIDKEPQPEYPHPFTCADVLSLSLSDAATLADANTSNDGNAPVESLLYYASCLSELANGQPSKAWGFYVNVTASASTFSATFRALKTSGATVSEKETTGGYNPPARIEALIGANGSFVYSIGLLTIPSDANSIGGSDVSVADVAFKGRYQRTAFCTRLTGHIDAPAAAVRDLDAGKNVCLFTLAKDGDPRSSHVFADYSTVNCPL